MKATSLHNGEEQRRLRSVADLRHRLLLQQAAAFKKFNEKMYKSTTFFTFTTLLALSSKPMMGTILFICVYEPASFKSRLYSFTCVYSRVRNANFPPMHRGNLWMFASLSVIPLMFYVFLYLMVGGGCAS